MKIRYFVSVLTVCIVFVLTAGCATNRGYVNITMPGGDAKAPNGKTVFIESVEDNRVFEEKPASPDIPSLGFEGATNSSDEIKSRAIARKRNGWGMALGDILLKEDQTVETVIHDALEQALFELGYEVVKNAEDVNENTMVVRTSIEKFWSYMSPGFSAITLITNISTTLKIKIKAPDGERSEEIMITTSDKFMFATEDAWMEVINMAMRNYIDEVKRRI